VPLVVVSTPIGNVADASDRLRDVLRSADVIAAEDTRRTRRLLAALGIQPAGRLVSHYEHNEEQRVDALLAQVREGRTVALVTDAGTPLVSDPGYRLVSAAAAEGLPVRVVPGPSAVTAALALSGLAVDRWCFEGFMPRRAAERRRLLRSLAQERRTIVFFEAPHRLAATLADLVAEFGEHRPAAVCRELTKVHEEVRRGGLAALAAWATQGEVRGEITLVVAGAPAREQVEATDEELAIAVTARVAAGESRRDAATAVAAAYGVSRRRVYELAHD
jgi:16S rRNA (cytidine1402-2'-O)-methyltransferase